MTSYNRQTNPGSISIYTDIWDELFDINLGETKLMDMGTNIEAKDQVHYWTEKTYTKKTSNPYRRTDGAATTSDTPPQKEQFNNNISESAVNFDVSKRSQAISTRGGEAGVRNQYANAKTDAMVELKNAVEWDLLNGTKTDESGATPSQMDGLMSLASTNGVSSAMGSVSGAEGGFRAFLDRIFDTGGLMGNKRMVLVSYRNKDVISSNWTGNATVVQGESKDTTLYADVKYYSSQYGVLMIEGHRNCAETEGVVFDADEVNLAWLYNTDVTELGLTGVQEGNLLVSNCLTLQYEKPSTLGYMTFS